VNAVVVEVWAGVLIGFVVDGGCGATVGIVPALGPVTGFIRKQVSRFAGTGSNQIEIKGGIECVYCNINMASPLGANSVVAAVAPPVA